MNDLHTNGNGHKTSGRTTARSCLAILLRHRRLVIWSFVAIFAVAATISLLWEGRYQASMLILVDQNERADPVVSGQSNAPPVINHNGVSVEELNSEIALLRSRDLLRTVVMDCDLTSHPGYLTRLEIRFRNLSPQEITANSVRSLAQKLRIEVLPMSNMIQVSYRSSDPHQAAEVLHTLAELYMKKHAAVHRPPGVETFFQQQTRAFQQDLAAQQAQLVSFTRNYGVVSAQVQMEASLQGLSEFQAMQEQNDAALAGTEQRIRELEAEHGVLHPRLTTQVKNSDNAQLLQSLKSTLLGLEIKRTDLLEKFKPSYRPVQEVEKQLEQTRQAIASAEADPWQEVTTDTDPDFELVREEITKARANLADYQARTIALARAVQNYRAQAGWLQREGIAQQNLMREVKTTEANYLLYLSKGEEARIAEALDSRRILNVAMAEAPSVPALPVHSSAWYLVLSGFIACICSVGLAFVADSFDSTLRSPNEAEMLLAVPVLGALPGFPKQNGNGNGHAAMGSNGKGNGKVDTHVS